MRATITAATMALALWALGPGSANATERLDLNTATEEQLAALHGVGPGFAKRIIAVRERNGGFRCVEEVRAVPRLPEKTLEKLLPQVTVKGPRRTDCERLERARRKGADATGGSDDAPGSI